MSISNSAPDHSLKALRLVLVLVLLSACSSLSTSDEKKAESKNNTQGAPADPPPPGTPAPDPGTEIAGLEPFQAKINYIHFDPDRNEIIAALQYEPGHYPPRSKMSIELKIDDTCGESYPLQCRATLMATPMLPEGERSDSDEPEYIESTFSVGQLSQRPASLQIVGHEQKTLASVMLYDTESALPWNFNVISTEYRSATKVLNLVIRSAYCFELNDSNVFLDVEGPCGKSAKQCIATLKMSKPQISMINAEQCSTDKFVEKKMSFWLPMSSGAATLEIRGAQASSLATVSLDQ